MNIGKKTHAQRKNGNAENSKSRKKEKRSKREREKWRNGGNCDARDTEERIQMRNEEHEKHGEL